MEMGLDLDSSARKRKLELGRRNKTSRVESNSARNVKTRHKRSYHK